MTNPEAESRCTRRFFFNFNTEWVEWIRKTRKGLLGRVEPLEYAEEGWLQQMQIEWHLTTIVAGGEITTTSDGEIHRVRPVPLAPKKDPSSTNPNFPFKKEIVHDEKTNEWFIKIPLESMGGISNGLDPDLWARLYGAKDWLDDLPPSNVSPEEVDAVFREKTARVIRIVRSIREIHRIAEHYDLEFEVVLSHVLYGITPTMKDYNGEWQHNPRTNVINPDISNRDKLRNRIIKRGKPPGFGSMKREHIIRTWTIFLLSDKGGGMRQVTSDPTWKRTDRRAKTTIELWNTRFRKHWINPDGQNYYKQLLTLFGPRLQDGTTQIHE